MNRRLALTAAFVAAALAPTDAAAEGGLRKGPWLMDMRPGSVVVMVERSQPGAVHVSARPLGPADNGRDAAPVANATPVEADDRAEESLHEVTLRGLVAGTRYAYEVTGPGLTAASGTFSTAPEGSTPFRFVIYGDTRSDDRAHQSVVNAMVREGPDFIVHTGDLVADGRDLDDWQDFFDIEAPILRNTVFVPVIGNHEVMSLSSPGTPNYQRFVHFDPSGPTPELDTVFRFANARFVLTSSYDDWTGPSREWLVGELERARREEPDGWLFVVMHEGPRSSGPHGDSDALRDAGIDRLLRRMHVDLVISGHDHAYERGDWEGIRYMVSGGGGAPLYAKRTTHASTRVFRSEHHLVRGVVERDRVKFTTVRPDGTILDEVELYHDGWSDMHARPRATVPMMNIPPETPRGPWVDWKMVAKFAPLAVLVSALAWLLRRKAEEPERKNKNRDDDDA